jgi:hypothetical protein
MATWEHRQRIGYDTTDDVDTQQANTRDAMERFKRSVERAGLVVVGTELDVELVRSPGLDRIGQYAIEIRGQVSDGD